MKKRKKLNEDEKRELLEMRAELYAKYGDV